MAKDAKKTHKTDGAPKGDGKPKGAKKAKTGKSAGVKASTTSKASDGFDALARLADHPLVSDLLAVGAMAAVAAIAERGVASRTGQQAVDGSRKAVKAAGKAAAAAIGARLLKEVGDFGAKTKGS